jgi:hypothetical protein
MFLKQIFLKTWIPFLNTIKIVFELLSDSCLSNYVPEQKPSGSATGRALPAGLKI